MAVPDSVLRELAADPEFRALPEDAQDRIVERLAQEHFKDVPKSENILQRAAKSAGNTAMRIFGPQGAMTPEYQGAQSMRREGVNSMTKNPFARFALDMATNPETYVGAPAAAKSAPNALIRASRTGRGAKQAISDVMNPVRASEEISSGIEKAGSALKQNYAKGFKELVLKNQGKTTSYVDILDSPQTLAEKRVFDAVKKEAEFQGINLSQLGPEESKRVLDIVKDKVGASITSGDVGPTEITTAKAMKGLKSRQLEAFPEFSKLDKAYGNSIENYHDLSGRVPNILEGAGNRITKNQQMNSLKSLDKNVFKRARNYRRANVVVKTARNPLVRAGAVLGGAASGAAKILLDD